MNLDCSKEYVLENEIVRLIPLQLSDIKNLSTFSINEPELWKYSLQQGGGLENLKKYIHLAIEGKKQGHSYPFIVFDKRTNEFAGSTRFYDIQPVHNTTQLGFTWYGKRFQGTGLNKNCKYLMLNFAFDKMGCERVEFRADNNNARSIAAMKSIGCTVEGVLRSNCQGIDGRRDSIVLSILKNEWEGGVKEKLAKKIN